MAVRSSPSGHDQRLEAGACCLFFFFFFFFNLTYSRWTSSLPSSLWSQRIFPSLPGSRLIIFYRDASSALLQLVNQWLNFYLLTFPRFTLRKKEHKSYVGKNRTHDFRTSRCAGYLLDHSGDEAAININVVPHIIPSSPVALQSLLSHSVAFDTWCESPFLNIPRGKFSAFCSRWLCSYIPRVGDNSPIALLITAAAAHGHEQGPSEIAATPPSQVRFFTCRPARLR